MITSESVDRWRVVPRILVTGYGVAMWQVADWFMALPDPSPSQAAFVSTMSAMGAGIFGLYVNSGGKRE